MRSRTVLLLVALLALLPACPSERARVRGPADVDTASDPLPPGAVARLGTTRLRPGGWIDRLMFSPDGKRLVSWGGANHVSKAISIWEVATGRELRRIPRPETQLEAWAWLPDGRGIAVIGSGP